MEATPISVEFLDELVARTDLAGGPNTPGAAAVWAEMPAAIAAEDLARFEGIDPFGSDYGELQLELWRRWSGREYDPAATEWTGVDVEAHATSRTGYGPGARPLALAQHYVAMTRAVSALGVDGSRALEIGAGWGLQAEVLSELGFDVDVIDVNRDFIEVIGRRMRARGFGGHQVVGTFTDFTAPAGGYDLAYTYEALHHTPQPLATIRRLVDPDGPAAGRLAFVGEPVVDMWPSWGLRIDQESLYCIRKFGWFESGWTSTFILSCIARVGLGAHLMRACASDRDGAVLGATVRDLDPADRATWTPFVAGWSRDGDGLMSLGESSLAFAVDDRAEQVVLDVGWYHPRPSLLDVGVYCGAHVGRVRTEVLTGRSELAIDLPPGSGRVVSLVLDAETWCPYAVIGSGDRRRISIDVLGVRTISGSAGDRPLTSGTAVVRDTRLTTQAKQRLRRMLWS